MTCEEFRSRLSSYLDGELPQWSRWKVDLHLRSCDACREQCLTLEDVDFALRGLADATPAPEFLTEAVMRRIPAMPPAYRPRGFWPWAAGMVLAGVQFAAIGSAWWWGFHAAGQSTTPAHHSTTASFAPATGPAEPGRRGSGRQTPGTAVPRIPGRPPAGDARAENGRRQWGTRQQEFTPPPTSSGDLNTRFRQAGLPLWNRTRLPDPAPIGAVTRAARAPAVLLPARRRSRQGTRRAAGLELQLEGVR